MTHITQELALKMALKFGDWTGQTVELNDVGLQAFATAAIDHYIEQSVSELTGTAYKMPDLSAELPEPAIHPEAWAGGFFTRDQLTTALAAQDAKWQGFEQDYLAKCKELDILQAERDAALEKLEAEQALSAMRKGMVDGLLELRKLDEEADPKCIDCSRKQEVKG